MLEEKRKQLESKFQKPDSDYIKKFETTISSGMEAAQKELAAAIEAGDAQAQVEANKRIATLAFEECKTPSKLNKDEKNKHRLSSLRQRLNRDLFNNQRWMTTLNPDPGAEA